MQIGSELPPIHAQDYSAPNPARANDAGAAGQARTPEPGVVVDISPRAWEAYKKGQEQPGRGVTGIGDDQECQTCKNRRYVDVSDDPSVSFQSPTHISPGQSAAAVSSHEGEHVAHERANAEQEGREIISQTVTLNTSICPECKKVYVSGGVTRTISRQVNQMMNQPKNQLEDLFA